MRVSRPTALLLTALYLASAGAAEAQRRETALLSDVSVEARDGAVSVSIATSGAPRYQATTLDRPPRVVFEFADAEFAWTRSPLAVAVEPVKEVRGSQHRKGVARIVIELTKKSEYRVAAQPDGLRVIFPSPRVAEASTTAPPPSPSAPQSATSPSAAPPSSSAAPLTTRPVLYGIILGERGFIAYIEDPETRQVSAHRVGGTVAGRTIETIEEASVTLLGPEGTLRLQLSDDKPGSVRPRSR